jgi:hypothetical protein
VLPTEVQVVNNIGEVLVLYLGHSLGKFGKLIHEELVFLHGILHFLFEDG